MFITALFTIAKTFLSLLAALWSSAFRWVYLSFSPLPLASLLFSAICKSSSDNHFAFLHFFSWGWFWSPPPVQCHELLSICLQALCVWDLIPWIYLSLPVYNWKDSDLDHIWGSSGFPYFLQFKSEFCNKEFMIQATVSSPSCFCWVLICRVHHAKYHAVWSTNWNQDCQEKYQ